MFAQDIMFATPIDALEQDETTDLMVGIIRPLTSPYNLFINYDNITDNKERYVYFFVYVFGKNKIILWGLYDKITETFSIDGGCKYEVAQLQTMINHWKSKNINYVGNSVVDRISERMKLYMKAPPKMSPEEYEKLKNIHDYFVGQIDFDEFSAKCPGCYEQFLFDLSWESQLNPGDPGYASAYMKKLDDLDRKIVDHEPPVNPREEYEKNKYLNSFYMGEITLNDLERRYPGVYDNFLLELSRETGLTPADDEYYFAYEEKMSNLLEKIIKYEKSINRTDVSPFGPSINNDTYNLIIKITSKFYEEIKYGKYDSSSFMNRLNKCPQIKSCHDNIQENGCEVYHYGLDIFSPIDMKYFM